MNILVSIIVPIYKVEPYLAQCVSSIIHQNYKNIEIILVDDGSPDNCPAICDEYAKIDYRVKVIHKENGGLSDARNAGLDIAKGEWVTFIDSDDWIAENFIDLLLHAALKEDAEIAVGNFKKTISRDFSKASSPAKDSYQIYSPIDAVKQLWKENKVTFVIACGKLYKRKLFNDIKFPIGLIHEDEYTSYKLLYKSSKTVFVNRPLYFYYQRTDSIMGLADKSSVRALKASYERYLFFEKNNEPELVELCLKTTCWEFLFAYSEAKIFKKIPLGFDNADQILQKFRSLFHRYKVSIRNKDILFYFLSFFSKFPITYVLYRKLAPIHIRKN